MAIHKNDFKESLKWQGKLLHHIVQIFPMRLLLIKSNSVLFLNIP
jgi:hypothetical protein